MYSLWERIKSGIAEFVQSRIFVLIIVFCITSAILVQRIFYLQIVKGQEYLDDYKLQIQKTKEIQGTRGNIYDRNGNLLAYNELAYSVTIEDNGSYDSIAQQNKVLNKTISSVIKMVESNGDTVINNFGIILDSNNNYQFVAQNETQKLRFIADVYGKSTIDQLSKKQKATTADELIHYLCTDKQKFGINEKEMDKSTVLKLINIRYQIWLNSYQKYISTTIAEDVSDATVADIMENLDKLSGINVEEESLRKYADSKCFANIIGYTGQISQEEYDALSDADQERYSKTDTVGKAGLEKAMDSQLQGKKGSEKLYVNNVGKVIKTVKGTNPKAGNDLYLTIDANLQKAAYNILEQELAGVLLAKIQNSLDFDRNKVEDGSDVIIPIGDVYNAMINNDVLDMTHFTDPDAGEAEKEVASAFSIRKEEVKNTLTKVLNDSKAAAYKDQPKEVQAYLTYLVSDVLTNGTGVLMSKSIDTKDATYKAWKDEESINVYTYLNYAISKNWIDTSLLKDYIKSNEQYSDSGEVYQGIINYILDYINTDNNFDKLIYRYMIKSGTITGRQICMMLYEQNILDKKDNQYDSLKAGSIGAYDFIRSKIQSLEITPGQLGLEPCTGSLVATDPNTGEVLACVSYPGYDNNRLANTMDSDYYSKLLTNQSRPFYNNATQEKTAPGSTYKPLSAITGLTEGVIDVNTYLPCTGVYKKVTPNPKCWIYPSAHGNLNVSQGIQHSCNDFFYEVGYRLGQDENGNYDSSVGLEKLEKYASMFGLDQTSGVEIPESDPQISDTDAVRSAIGQGTNNYTVSQLNRYVTAVANRGTVYKLSLVGKTTDADGKLIKEYEPEVVNQMDEVSSSTWDLVHNGMESMVKNSSVFSKMEIAMGGKTGTAQQSKVHPDHVLFAGYAPADDPQIAITVRIANGYSSNYAAEIGRDITKVYFDANAAKDLITGKASSLGKAGSGD